LLGPRVASRRYLPVAAAAPFVLFVLQIHSQWAKDVHIH
jgi:hypothetical protein